MKPFDLKAALAGEPVVTRKGDRVRIIHIPERVEEPVLVVFRNGNTYTTNAEGRWCWYNNSDGEHAMDLLMAPKEQTFYLNFYKGQSVAHIYKDRDLARQNAMVCSKPDERLAIAVPVTIEI